MALKDASREVRLQWFARAVIDATWQGLRVDSDDIQAWAKSAGLIDENIVTDEHLAALSKGEGPLVDVENSEHLQPMDSWMSFSHDLQAENVRWHELAST